MKNFILIVLIAFSITAHGQNGPSIPTANPVKSKFIKPILSNGVAGHHVLTVPSPEDHLSSSRFSDVQVLDSFYHWMWDVASGQWQNVYGIINYEYNDANLPVTFSDRFWDGTNWIPGTRFVINYDGSNNNTLEVEQFWNGDSWIDSYRTVSTYDGASNLVLQINQGWDGNVWVDDRRQTFTYDGNNHLLSLTIEMFESNQWVNQVRYTYTYDGEGNLTSQKFEGWNESQWDNVNQSLFTYDANGNQLTNVYQGWDTGGWLDILRYINTYDGNNHRLSQTIQFWTINEWVNHLLINSTYDGDLLSAQIVDQWNGVEWIESEYYTYEYDANGNNTYYLRRTWNGLAWVNAQDGSYAFDIDNNLIYVVNKTYTASGNEIMSGDSSHYYYRTISGTGTITNDNDDILIYPNPGYGKVNISSTLPITTMMIYNLQGQIVHGYDDQSARETIEVDLSHASKGMYFAKIVCAGNAYSKVIVIQ